MLLTAEHLREIVDYNPESGEMTWKVKYTRRVIVGETVGYTRKDGYKIAKIHRKPYLIQRLAWLYHYGQEPAGFVDHINGNPSDNRICNLRLATHTENMRNTRLRRDNKTGHRGVVFNKRYGNWIARICVGGGAVKQIGTFDTKELAAVAYSEASKKYHGEFSRNN